MHPIRLLLAVGACAAAATAQFTVVSPQGYDVLEGGSNNTYPWNRAAASMHYQQIIDSTHFTNQGVVGPIMISKMRFRANATAATWAGGSWPNVVIDMSTAAVDYTAYSTTFASNHGPDRTNVLTGQVTVQPGTGNGTTTPGPWHIDIPLTTSFLYDPTTGSDLVFDVELDGTGWSGSGTACDAVSGAATVPPVLGTRLWDTASANGAVASGSAVEYGLVCEFTYLPANGLFSAFSATPTSGPLNTQVNFTDQSFSSDPAGVLAWQWDVDGDSIIDYTTQNCMHTYTTEGSYDVSLTTTDAAHGSVTLTKTQYIEIDAVTASFTTQFLPGNLVVFTDTSVGSPTSWAWDVDGDSIVDYTTQNCAHPYPAAGGYDVTLTVADAISTDSVTTNLGVNIIPVSAWTSTYTNATQTRGFWFQSPTKFSIISTSVPDESNHGMQNVAIYRMPAAPASTTGELEHISLLQPSGTPVPCVVSFDVGDYVGVLGACGDATTMRNSYGAGGFASSVLGQPITLSRFYTQVNLNSANPENFVLVDGGTGSIARVVCGVTSAAGVPYGTGTPSGAGPDAPKLRCTALPFIGQTTTMSVEQGDTGVLGFMVSGLGRANVPTPFGTVLVANMLNTELMNGGLVVGPGTYTYSWNVPNNAALIGVDVNHQYAQLLISSSQIAISNAVELQFAQ